MRRIYSLFLSRTEPVSYQTDTFESGAMDASTWRRLALAAHELFGQVSLEAGPACPEIPSQ
jgi:hypothetical protein